MSGEYQVNLNIEAGILRMNVVLMLGQWDHRALFSRTDIVQSQQREQVSSPSVGECILQVIGDVERVANDCPGLRVCQNGKGVELGVACEFATGWHSQGASHCGNIWN